jgi:hypothetical protein
MPSRIVFDTVAGTAGERQRAYREGDSTHLEYSNGVELTVEKTGDGGQDGMLKEVRTVTRTKTRRTYGITQYAPGQYERIFKREKD